MAHLLICENVLHLLVWLYLVLKVVKSSFFRQQIMRCSGSHDREMKPSKQFNFSAHHLISSVQSLIQSINSTN